MSFTFYPRVLRAVFPAQGPCGASVALLLLAGILLIAAQAIASTENAKESSIVE